MSLGEAFEHEQTKARQMVQEITTATDGVLKQLGFAYKLSDTPPRVNRMSPELGEHTEELLTELGIAQDEQERMKEAGIVR